MFSYVYIYTRLYLYIYILCPSENSQEHLCIFFGVAGGGAGSWLWAERRAMTEQTRTGPGSEGFQRQMKSADCDKTS